MRRLSTSSSLVALLPYLPWPPLAPRDVARISDSMCSIDVAFYLSDSKVERRSDLTLFNVENDRSAVQFVENEKIDFVLLTFSVSCAQLELQNMATSGLEYQLLQGQTPCKDINKFKPVSKIQKSLRQLCQNADNASKQSNRENYEQCAKKCLGNCGLDLSGFLMCLKNYHKFPSAIEKNSDICLVPITSEDAKRCLNSCTNYDEIIQRNK
ncbi:hypothetical protein QTP88_006745 [Uroleucon formosanum]